MVMRLKEAWEGYSNVERGMKECKEVSKKRKRGSRERTWSNAQSKVGGQERERRKKEKKEREWKKEAKERVKSTSPSCVCLNRESKEYQ